MRVDTVRTPSAFRHEAMLYRGLDGFLEGTVPFLCEGVEQDEAILVVVAGHKIAALRKALGAAVADRIVFADMADVGRNPARIIPAWRRFVDEHLGDGRGGRGIGEPIYPSRSATELVECQLHEQLLNVAFDGGVGWWLLCPYDLETMPDAVILEAERSHPFLMDGHNHSCESRRWVGSDIAARPIGELLPGSEHLPDPPVGAAQMIFGGENAVDGVRAFVASQALTAGLAPLRVDDLVLAASELAANSLRHGGGRGVLRMWVDGANLVTEVTDGGHFHIPLAGRVHPSIDGQSGRGLWLVNQLCELLQIRSGPTGTVVRIHMARA